MTTPEELVPLRPEVRRFAEQIELRLQEHEETGGFCNGEDGIVWWLDSIAAGREELRNTLLLWGRPRRTLRNPAAIIRETADIGCFTMMIANHARPKETT